MHYYQHNINDWRAETRHLSLIESAIYSELVDEYLSNEEPLTSNLSRLQKRIRVKTKPERDALAYVLDEFFYLSEDGECYHCKKLDDTISEYQESMEAKARAGRASAKARKSASNNKQDESRQPSEDKQANNTKGTEEQQESNSNSTQDEQKPNTNEQVLPNHKPITTNHELDKKNKQKKSEDEIEESFNVFWASGMAKVGKQSAFKAFSAKLKSSGMSAQGFADMLVKDVKSRLAAKQFGFDQLHPTTYLNNHRWEDEIVKNKPDVPLTACGLPKTFDHIDYTAGTYLREDGTRGF